MELVKRLTIPLLALAGTILGVAAPASSQPTTSVSKDQANARAAVVRALPLIQSAGQSWLDRSTCTSCHHQSLGFLAAQVSKDNGFKIDEAALASQVAESNKRRFKYTEPMYQLAGAINGVSGHGYQLLALAAMQSPPNDFTDAAGFFLTAMQSEKGHWPSSSHRPPIEDSAFTLTATSIRALKVYPWANQSEQTVRRARGWLLKAKPRSAEDRAMKLLGLVWSKASADDIRRARNAILAQQEPDGGWSQMPGLPSDSYATGQALVALKAAGEFPARSPAFARGARFLVSTQQQDGSWRVPTRRVVSGLPYFETGFPHGVDQFISTAGTCWATMALAVYATDGHVDALISTKPAAREHEPAPMAVVPADEPVFQAILHGTVQQLQSALKSGANPNTASTKGVSPLMLAVRNPEMVKVLLTAGADPNVASPDGSTALAMAAATHGALPSMKLLLAAKADPNKGKAAECNSPLAAATRTYQTDRLRLLLEGGANSIQDAFSIAYALEDVSAIELLIAKGADVNKENEEYGGNAVNDAVINRNASLVKLLLSHGVSPNVIDKEGFSALQVAALGDPQDSKIVALLLDAGADVNYESKEHPKALGLALAKGNRVSAALIKAATDRRVTYKR